MLSSRALAFVLLLLTSLTALPAGAEHGALWRGLRLGMSVEAVQTYLPGAVVSDDPLTGPGEAAPLVLQDVRAGDTSFTAHFFFEQGFSGDLHGLKRITLYSKRQRGLPDATQRYHALRDLFRSRYEDEIHFSEETRDPGPEETTRRIAVYRSRNNIIKLEYLELSAGNPYIVIEYGGEDLW